MGNLFVLAAMAAEDAAKQHEGLEERVRAAMGATADHWALRGDDDQFRAAIAGVMVGCTDEERERLEKELGVLKALAAATDGIPVDFDAVDKPDEFLGLAAMWREIQDKKTAKG